MKTRTMQLLLDLSTPLLNPVRQMDFRAMVRKAVEFGVVEPILICIAILKTGDLIDRKRAAGKKLCVDQHDSDVLRQLAVFTFVQDMWANQMLDAGIHLKSFHQADGLHRRLRETLQDKIAFTNTGSDKDIMICIVAGMLKTLCPKLPEQLGQDNAMYEYADGHRQLDRTSIVTNAPWIVGDNHEVTTQGRGGQPVTLRFVRMATRVTPAILSAVAPEQVRAEEGIDPYHDPEQGACLSTARFVFADRIIHEELVIDHQHLEAPGLFAEWIMAQMLATEVVNVQHEELGVILRENQLIRHVATQLNIRAGEEKIPVMDEEQLIAWLWEQLGTASSIQEVPDLNVLRLPAIDEQIELQIMHDNQEFIDLVGAPQQVCYPEGQAPYIILTEEVLHELTDATICLPGGRAVDIFVQFSDDCWLSGSNIGELKELIERYHQLTQYASIVHMDVIQARMWALQAPELQWLARLLKQTEESFPKTVNDYAAWVISAQELLDEHATVLGPALRK